MREYVVRPGVPLALAQGAAEFLVRKGGRVTSAEAGVFAANGSRPATRRAGDSAAVAIVPLVGLIAPGIPFWLGTDPNEARAEIRQARTDQRVDGIVLLIDSPGGVAQGIEELAAEVRAARAAKPTTAIVAGMAASAAYWAASSAGRVVVTPSGEVGSIGVYMLHEDVSRALDQAGITVNLIASKVSPHKVEDNPFEPLSDAARKELQRVVDRIAGQFVGEVALGRGVGRDRVEIVFGQGRTVDAREAVRRGMADELATPEDALARLRSGGAGSATHARQAQIALARLL